MTWTLKTRGASSQLMEQDFLCSNCGPCSALAPRDVDGIPCPDGCGRIAVWAISAPSGFVRAVEVIRGGVAKADSPLYCDTRPLAEGMSMSEWRAKRAKVAEERRWKEAKELG